MDDKQKAHDIPDIEEIAKRRGFFWPSFEIYGGCSGFFDYGPYGSLLKSHIENIIRDYYITEEGCLVIEAPSLTTEDPWVASGHVHSFTDMTAECEKCGEAYRADHLVEDKTKEKTEGLSLQQIQTLIDKNKISCPKCGGRLGKAYDYNLMFKTYIGPGKNKVSAALRPETAQTTYMPFRRLFEIGRKKLPLGVIQIGRSYRNEISPRKALVRLREFSQAEIQFFLHPKHKKEYPDEKKFSEFAKIKISALTKEDQSVGRDAKTITAKELLKKTNRIIAYFLLRSVQLYEKMGMDMKKLRLRQHKDDERSFYSNDTWDVEFISEKYGRIELVGIADRTDYDLKRHQELSKQDMSVSVDGERFIPHVVEVAYGIDRPLLCILESCIRVDKDRVYFAFPPASAPYQVAIFPLVRKDKLPEKAKEVFELLRRDFFVVYDESGSIGRMYYRQDEVGTPHCITVDYDSLKRNDVTIRNRDNQKQVRVKTSALKETIEKLIAGMPFEKAGKAVKKSTKK